MPKYSQFFASLLISLLWLQISFALIDDPTQLHIEAGETYYATGVVYRSDSIVVDEGGTLLMTPDKGLEPKMNLIAPTISIQGSVVADAISVSTTGMGTSGPAVIGKGEVYGGDGGAGFGGKGGNGGGPGTSGVGGPVYSSSAMELSGSRAYFYSDDTGHGKGGGSIRLDAIKLDLGKFALISATGGYQKIASWPPDEGLKGGGSGGQIVLDSITTQLPEYYTLNVAGGRGESDGIAGGGGGAGGRIKIYQHHEFHDEGGSKIVNGGLGGEHGAQNGGDGMCEIFMAPIPGIPQLQNPLNGQSVGRSLTFTFSASEAARSKFMQYKLEVSLDNTFAPASLTLTANQVVSSNGWSKPAYFYDELASFSVPYPLEYNTIYYWRVAVSNNNGYTFSNWSVTRSFLTINNDRPAVPRLLLPADGQTQSNKTPLFRLTVGDPEGDTLTCAILVAKDIAMSNPQAFLATYPGWDQSGYIPEGAYLGITASCQILNSESHPDALEPGTTYYWKATVSDAFQGSRESALRTFTTVARPSVPQRIYPLAAAIVTTKNPSLSFYSASPSSSPLKYKLELSSDDFKTVITFWSENGGGWSKQAYASGETAQLNITSDYTLVPGKTYSWRVTAYDVDNDNWSFTTDIWKFSVVTPPLQTTLVSPADHYLAPDEQLTFSFTAASESGNTLTYRFDLSDNQFQTVLQRFEQAGDKSGWSAEYYRAGTEAGFQLPASSGLQRGREYWWRVYATDGISWSAPSAMRQFQVANTLDLQAVRIGPNPAVSQSALRIQIQVSVDSELHLRFYNKLGKEIGQMRTQARGGLQANEYQYDISTFAVGVYYCVIEATSAFGEKKITKRFAVVN